ncbi:MAG: Stk1 family PASTA domain-containing Ser/Thr kinase [Clostridia bacterium]|nr:Stk1 family PASTA domain-containing Ser/Thr kinase [Clostridia bacterium]
MSEQRILAGRYRLLEQIGSGGMAIVYKAEDRRTGHFVAVKLLRPELAQNAEYVSRFQREAQAASKMTHHNIVNLLDVGMDGDNRYLVMEYVPGQTLKQVIQEKGRLPAQIAVAVTIRILSALQHAHENGIVHRDIKPQNILVNEDGLIKVADFGIARIADTRTLSQSDTVVGSVHYFSPEQASGGEADERSDIYSVGVVLYEMLTGRVPFDADNQVSIAMLHLRGQPEPIATYAPDVPPAVAHVCMVAMSKNPDLRYQSAREMAADLRAAIEGRMEVMQNHLPQNGTQQDKLSVGTAGGEPGSQKPRRRPNWLWWILTALVVVLVVGALGYGVYSIFNSAQTRVTVPDLIGLTRENAEARARSLELKLRVEEATNDERPAGTIFQQMPAADSSANKGDTITVTVSKGRDTQKASRVPNVTGYTVNEARDRLAQDDLNYSVFSVEISDEPVDQVLRQSPAAGADVPDNRTVALTISGGRAEVPDLTGMTLLEAREKLAEVNLRLSEKVETEENQDADGRNRVAWQSDPPGTPMRINAEVRVKIYVRPSELSRTLVTLSLPQSDGSQTVRVTLEIGGGEVLAYEGTFDADADREQEIELVSWIEGETLMRVYLNNALSEENTRTVVLQ